MEELTKFPKLNVELKQTSKGFWYAGALKINAESLEEFDSLVRGASNRVKERILQLNSQLSLQGGERFQGELGGGGGGKVVKGEKEKQEIHLNVEEQKLFQNLKELRLLLAQKEAVPPYIIFHDSHLKRLAKEKPQTKEDLIKIIGEKKCERYGELIEEILARFR